MAAKLLLIFFTLVGPSLADYDCLCTYQVETNIYEKPDLNSNVIGRMYEFDCKPAYTLSWIEPTFQPIGNEHILGFVEVVSQNALQVCQGSIPNLDKVPSAFLTPPPTTTTTTVTTTTLPTTTTTTVPITTTLPTTTPAPTTPTTPAPTTPTTPTPTSSPTTPTPTTPAPTTPATKPSTATTTQPTTATTTFTTMPTTKQLTTQTPTTPTTKPTTLTTTIMLTTPTTKTTTSTTTKPTTTSTTTRPTTMTTTPIPTTTKRTTLPTTHAHAIVTVPVDQVHGAISRCPTNVRSHTNQDNLYVHDQFCYEFVDGKNSFFHAQFDCPHRGGVLLYIRNQADNDFIYKIVINQNHQGPVWLGLHDVNKEEAWEWVSDYPLHYENWMPSRYIDGSHDAEDCGVFVAARHHGQWDDVHCKGILFSSPAEYPWICQYNITQAG